MPSSILNPKLFPPFQLPRSKSNIYFRNIRSHIRKLKQVVIAEVTDFLPSDSRPHATVSIGGAHLLGLLDSGASVSCLGRHSIERVKQLGLRMKTINQEVRTADGSAQPVVGYVEVDITYQDKLRCVRLYVIPSLSQELYLGIDFWDAFGIAPRMIEEIAPNKETPLVPDSNTHSLSHVEQGILDAVKREFLSSEAVGLGKTSVLQHYIDVGTSSPIKQRHHFVSPAIRAILYAEVDKMLEQGVIEESKSAWSSPVLVVKKANGKMRFCLDCRAVNNITAKDAYPMPIIEGILASLHETVYISSIDLKDAFWQIELSPESRDKTAFTVPGRPLYQFTRMPFGLCNAPQTMCRLMDKVIPTELREFVFVYLDDLLIVSKCFETHVERLKIVANCLREANLSINMEKSKFCMREIRYLGHIVGGGCIKPDQGKVEAVTKFPTPRTVRQVRSFLGMCGWYHRYIAGFAAIAAPITDLLKKQARFTWTDEAQVAFAKLKSLLTSAPVLTHPDFTRPFVIQCDASKSGVGGVLYQLDDQGDEHPIAYMSQKLNGAQRNYSVTELECLAAVLCLKKFRGYVEGMSFKVVTDHASLKWLMSQKDLTGRLARWSLKLQAFDFTIEHRKGSANIVPDALSRVYVDEIVADGPTNFLDLNDKAFEEIEYQTLRSHVLANSERLPDLVVRGRQVYIRTHFRRSEPGAEISSWRLWVPRTLIRKAMEHAHNPPMAAHPGTGKTLEKLRRYLFWPKMAPQVVEFVKKCTICHETKAPNSTLRPRMGQQVAVERPWQRLYIDLLGPYPRSKAGNTTLLIVLDQFTKFVLLQPLRKARTGDIIQFLKNEVFHMFGVPESIWSDNGSQFISSDFKELMRCYGVEHIRTATHAPQSNASERVNRSILSAIRAYITQDQQTWDIEISAIGSALRNNVHESTGFSPHFLVFGHHFVQHGSCYRLFRELEALPENEIEIIAPPDFRALVSEKVRKNLEAAYKRHEKSYNARSRNVCFSPGQEVYRRNFQLSNFAQGLNAKLGKQWIKARILRRIGNSMYELEDKTGKKLKLPYHAKDIKQ